MYASGFRCKEIAPVVFLSTRTVETMTTEMKNLLGAKSIAHLVFIAYSTNLL